MSVNVKNTINMHLEIASQILRKAILEETVDENLCSQFDGHMSIITKQLLKVGLSEKEITYALVSKVKDLLANA